MGVSLDQSRVHFLSPAAVKGLWTKERAPRVVQPGPRQSGGFLARLLFVGNAALKLVEGLCPLRNRQQLQALAASLNVPQLVWRKRQFSRAERPEGS
jgi:hypothetical protein